jgi:hypothetical protein
MFLVNVQVYSQIVNMLDELKALVTAANAYVIEDIGGYSSPANSGHGFFLSF